MCIILKNTIFHCIIIKDFLCSLRDFNLNLRLLNEVLIIDTICKISIWDISGYKDGLKQDNVIK